MTIGRNSGEIKEFLWALGQFWPIYVAVAIIAYVAVAIIAVVAWIEKVR